MNDDYFAVISLIERLHRQYLEVVKLELDRRGIHDINNVQAMMLFNIGETDVSVVAVSLKKNYLGTNVSYNVKKMVENGYLVQERSAHDRRSIRVSLTHKARSVRDQLSDMHSKHVELLKQEIQITSADLEHVITTMRQLERFWMRAVDLRPNR